MKAWQFHKPVPILFHQAKKKPIELTPVQPGALKRLHRLSLPWPGTLPTAAGLWALAAVCALLLIAINHSNNLVFATAFILFALVLQAFWQNRRMLRSVEAVILPPLPAFSGSKVLIEAEIVFHAPYPRTGLFLARSGQRGDSGNCSAAERCLRLRLFLQAEGRGWQHLDDLILCSRAPLGLWRTRLRLPEVRLLVYPEPAGNELPPHDPGQPAHGAHAAESFSGVREYVPGDALTRVNWRIYGRRDELVTNYFDGGSGAEAHAIRWDDAIAISRDTESCLSQLTRWVLDADSGGEDYSLELPDSTISPNRGVTHREACLRRLALFNRVPT